MSSQVRAVAGPLRTNCATEFGGGQWRHSHPRLHEDQCQCPLLVQVPGGQLAGEGVLDRWAFVVGFCLDGSLVLGILYI
jgi:hypothetical protein